MEVSIIGNMSIKIIKFLMGIPRINLFLTQKGDLFIIGEKYQVFGRIIETIS